MTLNTFRAKFSRVLAFQAPSCTLFREQVDLWPRMHYSLEVCMACIAQKAEQHAFLFQNNVENAILPRFNQRETWG